jgi:hypothetical protein
VTPACRPADRRQHFGDHSGSSLSGSSIFDNTSIASFGFAPGADVFSSNSSGVSAVVDDSIPIQVGAAVPEPLTSVMMCLSFAGYRARKTASIAA